MGYPLAVPVWSIVFWSYVALLVAGGVMGFVKAGSRASLIASGSLAAALAVAAFAGAAPVVLAAILAAIGLYFASRYAKSRKLMPGGVFCVLSLATAAVVFFLGR